MGTTKLKQVKYVGDDPTIRKGKTALIREDGKVQFDFGSGGWAVRDSADPRCYGWHDCGTDWVDVEQEVVWEPPK